MTINLRKMIQRIHQQKGIKITMNLLKYLILVKRKKPKVEVYIRDKDNDGSEAIQSFEIKDNKSINIPMKIEKGKTAGYTIRVDNKVVADKDVGYDD